MPTPPLVIDDGGRAEAGFRGKTGDCVCRSIAIAAELPYRQVYDALNAAARSERLRVRGRSSARKGVYRSTYEAYLGSLGWTWYPLMRIGSGCTAHLRKGEIPMGRLILRVSRHLVASIDGVLHDTRDPSRGGSRCVYGYYQCAIIERRGT
jgi:hypothetical protein